jgi:small subunit ribosomal protein S1
MSPELQEVTGFLPASQMIGLPLGLSRRGLQQRLDGRIGERVKVRLIELDPARERVVCSERAVSSNGTPASRLSQLSTMVGQSVEGTVRSIRGFGAFVDLGGVDGLLHVSKLGGERVRHPADVLHVGQAVQVEILSVDSEHGRVGLALKSFGPDPWAVVAERYSPGDLVEVEITTVRDFGAFARLPEGVEGLIHVSQLADGHFLHPRAVVAEGQYMTARVLDVDPQARRMGLSLRDVPLGL